MTFKYKLSARLALLKDKRLLLLLTTLIACEKPARLAGPGSVVTRIALFPTRVALKANQTSAFTAVGLTAAGDTGTIPVTWHATGGSFVDTTTSGDRHVATYQPSPLPGTYLVVAATTAGSMADTGTVTVVQVPVASVSLAPTVASLLVGATLQFAATPKDSAGAPLSGRVVTWSSTAPAVAPVSSSGLVTASAVGSATVTATSEGQSASATITVSSIPVATVTVSPASATLAVGATQPLLAVTKDSGGTTLTGRVVTWSSSNTSVAAVSSSGLVSGLVAGSATITATSEGKSGTSAITVQAPAPGSHAGYYVTPGGSSSGSGSSTSPWSLAYALGGAGGRVQPGDTIWLRGGNYYGNSFYSNLNGTAAAPIVVRQYPGELASIIGTATVNTFSTGGSYTWFWGFEVVGPSTPGSSTNLVDHKTQYGKLINLVVHDAGAVGIGFWHEGAGGEMNGCISYNNGPNGGGNGYGVYTNNDVANGSVKLFKDNVFWNNANKNIHAWGGGYPAYQNAMSNMHFDGNVTFGAGTIANGVANAEGMIVLGSNINGLQILNHFSYEPGAFDALRLPVDVTSADVLIQNSIFTRYVQFGLFTSAMVTGNTFYSTRMISGEDMLATSVPLAGFSWSANTHYRDATAAAWRYNGALYSLATWKSVSGLGATDQNPGAAPTGTQVFVRPNTYEPGRANIVIYNWAQAATVAVDLSGVLTPGQAYDIFNVQGGAPFPAKNPPVVSGVYAGGTVTLPMAGMTPVAPLFGSHTPAPQTGPTFQVFIVRLQGA